MAKEADYKKAFQVAMLLLVLLSAMLVYNWFQLQKYQSIKSTSYLTQDQCTLQCEQEFNYLFIPKNESTSKNCCYPPECKGIYNNSGCDPSCEYMVWCGYVNGSNNS